jgi:Abnormal spindle-like microcephaly-assoc'd, ASPM-SPD-2-Hydin/Protein of unknown function (DUF1573)
VFIYEKLAVHMHLLLAGHTTSSPLRALASLIALCAIVGTASCIGVTGKPVITGPTTGAASPTISITPATVNFGNVNVGTTITQSMLLANNGTADLMISQVSTVGTAFTLANLPGTATVPAGQNMTFTASFKPSAPGSASGSISIMSNATDDATTISLTGMGMATNQGSANISVSPSSASFGNVILGNTDSQVLTISNTGTANLTISSFTTTGSGFSTSGPAVPLTLTPGQNTTLTAAFGPGSAGSQSGIISITSNAAGSSLVVNLTGTGVAPTYQLSANSASLAFGNITVGNSATQNVTLTNTGNSNVSVSAVSASGTGFTESGGSNLTLTPNQSANFSVTFKPTATGGASGNISVGSNAANSPLTIPLSGTGVQSAPPSVALNWQPSTSQVIGYFVYRKIPTQTQYSKLNASVVPTTTYTDSTVSTNQTYNYAVTSVDSSNVESAFSNQVTVNIP